MQFKTWHQQAAPLLLANVWDVASARCAEQAGYQAIGTSSAAMAQMLGYADGEGMSFAELYYLVERILANTSLPLTVDLEAGYSREPEQVAKHIQMLSKLGVVGINLEDSLVDDKQRELLPAAVFSHNLSLIIEALGTQRHTMFFNIRSDAFLLSHPRALDESLARAQVYAQAGADGIFLPGVTNEHDIQVLSRQQALPLNILYVAGLPSFARLQALGVKRISMGNVLFDEGQVQLRHRLQAIKNQHHDY